MTKQKAAQCRYGFANLLCRRLFELVVSFNRIIELFGMTAPSRLGLRVAPNNRMAELPYC